MQESDASARKERPSRVPPSLPPTSTVEDWMSFCLLTRFSLLAVLPFSQLHPALSALRVYNQLDFASLRLSTQRKRNVTFDFLLPTSPPFTSSLLLPSLRSSSQLITSISFTHTSRALLPRRGNSSQTVRRLLDGARRLVESQSSFEALALGIDEPGGSPDVHRIVCDERLCWCCSRAQQGIRGWQRGS